MLSWAAASCARTWARRRSLDALPTLPRQAAPGAQFVGRNAGADNGEEGIGLLVWAGEREGFMVPGRLVRGDGGVGQVGAQDHGDDGMVALEDEEISDVEGDHDDFSANAKARFSLVVIQGGETL